MSNSNFDVSKRLHSTNSIFNFQFSIFNCVCVLLLFSLLITSCKKDEEKPSLEIWQQQNEQVFNDLAFNPDYTELKMPGAAASIYYRVIQKGEGKRVYYNSRAEIYYKGWYVVTNSDYNITAGTLFVQRLFDNGVPHKVAINYQVAADGFNYEHDGWSIALQYMVEGDKWEVHIPYHLAYGENGKGAIPGFTTLAYEIELIKAIDPDEFEWPTNSSSY